MHKKTRKLPYATLEASVFSLAQEQRIMSGSEVEDTLGDMSAIDILDEPFFTSII